MSAGSLKDMKESAVISRVRKKHSDGDILDNLANYAEHQWPLQDEVDSLPDGLRFNYFDIGCIIVSMVTYIFDLGMDICVAWFYYENQYIWYFVLTLIFVIIPAGTMTAFSLRWYVMDMDNRETVRVSCTKWIIRTVFLLLQLAPVLRYFDSLLYGLKSRAAAKREDKSQQIKYYTLMVNEDADASLLRLFEGFMESAPQVLLQLYILIYHFRDEKGPFKTELQRQYVVLAILSSLLSLAWSLTSYNRSARYASPDKPNISYKGTILQFIWHFCIISSRVFALGVFASTYQFLLVPVCIAHWLAMIIWLIVQNFQSGNQECANQCEEALLNLVIAFIYVFTFFNVRDEPTRYKYLIFYLICFLENTILIFTWFFSFNVSTPEILWFRVLGTGIDYGLFFLGVISMILYYVYFHPSLRYNKSISLHKEIQSENPSSHQQPCSTRGRSEFLTRKGSLDLGCTSNSHSATSSRKNVTFDLPKSQESIAGRTSTAATISESTVVNEETPL